MSQDTNPSFVLEEPGSFKYEDRSVPSVEDSQDVIVKVSHTGICGSDVHYWTEGRIGSFVVEAPLVLGHESSGIIHAVGSEVSDLKVGDRVALEPGVPCRRCWHCKSGTYNLCHELTFAATPPIDGTLCKYYRIPADFCYLLPEHVSLAEGALLEPTGIAVHMVKQASVSPGDSLIVFGAGPVGLLVARVARAFGASKIAIVDVNEDRVRFAESYVGQNLATGFSPSKDESAQDMAKRLIKECKLGAGADVAIDATGAEICIQTAIHALRTGGTYVQGGMGKPEVTLPITSICTREITVKGSFRYGPGDYALAVNLVSSDKISVKELISKTVGFKEAEQAFKDTKAAKGIKILIRGP